MVDRGTRNQGRDGSETRGRERKTTWFPVPVPYRSRLDYIFPSRPLPRATFVILESKRPNKTATNCHLRRVELGIYYQVYLVQNISRAMSVYVLHAAHEARVLPDVVLEDGQVQPHVLPALCGFGLRSVIPAPPRRKSCSFQILSLIHI